MQKYIFYRFQVSVSMVIRFAVQDGEGAIELLGEDEPRHDVGKGELREGDLEVLAGIDRFGEAVGAADDEHQSLLSCVGLLLDELRELFRRELLAPLVEEHDDVAGIYLLEDQVALALLLPVLRQGLGAFEIRDGNWLIDRVEPQFLGVLLNGFVKHVAIGASDPYQFDFHKV